MIVDSMTHEEVYEELARDRETLTTWWRHKLNAQRRRVIKAQLPLLMWFDYTSPRKVRYLIFTRIFNRKMRSVLTGIAAIRHTSEGISVYTNWISEQRLIAPMVITPHAFKRYAERMGVLKTGTDLVRYYFEHNVHGMDSNNQKVVGRSVRWNGEEHMSYCIPDGVMLGQKQGNIFIARTFITYDMCTGLQQREFEDKRKDIPSDKELYLRAREYYKGQEYNCKPLAPGYNA
jgi:hypothetical protein